jgi:hypothetical protein
VCERLQLQAQENEESAFLTCERQYILDTSILRAQNADLNAEVSRIYRQHFSQQKVDFLPSSNQFRTRLYILDTSILRAQNADLNAEVVFLPSSKQF